MLHTNEIRNEKDFKWHEWYTGSPLREEFRVAFSQELKDDHHLTGAKYYVVSDDDNNELLLVKTLPKEYIINLSLGIIKERDEALCLKNALERIIVPRCLELHTDRILIPNAPTSMRVIFEQLKSLHESEPIKGITSVSIDSDDAVRIVLNSTLPTFRQKS